MKTLYETKAELEKKLEKPMRIEKFDILQANLKLLDKIINNIERMLRYDEAEDIVNELRCLLGDEK